MMENLSDLSFEQALIALEKTVERLEAGELPLEESLKLFERGQELAAYCSRLLEEASLKVEQLTADGEIIDISPQLDD
jgi:exodeoxyribonuclease VII small subunit